MLPTHTLYKVAVIAVRLELNMLGYLLQVIGATEMLAIVQYACSQQVLIMLKVNNAELLVEQRTRVLVDLRHDDRLVAGELVEGLVVRGSEQNKSIGE